MAFIIRPLTQTYLLQALSAADRILDTTKRLSPEDVMFPFSNRSFRLLRISSQLLVFPAMVLIVITLGYGAGRMPMAVSDTSESMTTSIFPFAFYQSLWTKQQEEDYRAWEEFQVRASAQNALDDPSLLAELSTTRANLDLCQDNITFSFVQLSNNDTRKKRRNNNEFDAPVFKVATPKQLTSSKGLIKTTFVQVLRKLQQLAKKTRLMSLDASSSENPASRDMTTKAARALDEEHRQSHHDFHSLIQALAFHPLLTSTIILPVLDFFGFILSSVWILYFVYYGIKAFYRKSNRRRYVLKVKGESCRIMSVQK
eukprot:Sro1902_g304450.2  (313) ;mRNA; f:11227-12165